MNVHLHQRDQSCGAHNRAETAAQRTGESLRARAHGDAPLAAEQPQSIAEVETARDHAYGIKCQDQRILQDVVDLSVSQFRMRGQMLAAEALLVEVIADVHEGDDPADALPKV